MMPLMPYCFRHADYFAMPIIDADAIFAFDFAMLAAGHADAISAMRDASAIIAIFRRAASMILIICFRRCHAIDDYAMPPLFRRYFHYLLLLYAMPDAMIRLFSLPLLIIDFHFHSAITPLFSRHDAITLPLILRHFRHAMPLIYFHAA